MPIILNQAHDDTPQSNTSASGASGPAGGDLAGSYPNPTIKASVSLTGTPAAPTAAPGANTTQISTTAFVQAAIAALVASSPAALDTLNELAAALGNDANFATTITNALTLKANKDGTGLSAGEVIAWKTLLGLGTAAGLNVPVSGNAAANEVVKGNDTRITGAATTGKAIAMAIVFGG